MPERRRNEFQDINQFAADVRKSTQTAGPVDLTDQAAISQVMAAMGRKGGLKGAATPNAGLTPAQRKQSAQRDARARCGKKG